MSAHPDNLFLNPTLNGPRGEHGLPRGFTLAPYEHGVHYWRLPVRVEARVEVLPSAGPNGTPALRVEHPGPDGFRLLDPWDDYLPKPGFVDYVGIRADIAPIEPATVDRLFCLVYWGRGDGRGFCHARIQGPDYQNDPESIAGQRAWRRIEHVFIVEAGGTIDAPYFYLRVPEEGDAIELAGFELRYEGEFKPVGLRARPSRERVPQPDERAEVKVNPPTFSWADEPRESHYDLEISPAADFSRDVLRYEDVHFNFFKPTTLLKPGRWFWRRRPVGGAFAKPVAFTMPEGAVEYLTPAFADILASTRRDHPRLFVTRDTLDGFRRTAAVTNAESWKRFLRYLDHGEHGRHHHHRRRTEEHRISELARTLRGHSFAWLVAADEARAHQARECLARLLDVPFEGVTRHRHSELNHQIVPALSLCYDWLHDLLTDEERRRTREAIYRRCLDIYEFYRAGLGPFASMERFLYDSHATYMMQTILCGALAIVGEFPGASREDSGKAERLMEYWLMAGISFYPPWSSADGSWAQGTGYCSPYVDHSDVPEARMVRAATGLDLFRKPFFRNHRDFILYSYPPFGLKAPFGDLGSKDGPHDNDLIRFSRIAANLAAEFDDPYAAWYAAVATPLEGTDPTLAVQTPKATAAPKPPVDLPLAKLFPDTGWALLHTDLTGKDDVFLAFKSSPYGSISHSHADQNSFVLSVGNRRLLTDAGYYAGYGTPHHLGFYKHTRAHNTILVDGRGQLINESKAGGHVTRFQTSAEIDYVVGDAQAAYGGLLDRFDRHIVFMRPNVFILFDDVIGSAARSAEWLLHSPLPFETDEDAGTLLVRNGPAFARIHLRGPGKPAFSVTDRFDPPPRHSPERPPGEIYKDEYHFTARWPERRREMRFLAWVGVGEFVRRETLPVPEFVETDSWTGVVTPDGSAFFRTGHANSFEFDGRRVETDARSVVLRPSGACMLLDGTRLTVDGVPMRYIPCMK